MTALRPALAAMLLAFVAGCADESRYPSLAPRPVEGIMNAPVVPAIVPPATPDPARAAKIADLLGKAEAGDRAFQATRVETEKAIAAAAGVPRGDERWINAQQQLSRLQTERAPVTSALADLDDLALTQADAAASGVPSAEADALASAQRRVGELDAAEQDALQALTKTIGY